MSLYLLNIICPNIPTMEVNIYVMFLYLYIFVYNLSEYLNERSSQIHHVSISFFSKICTNIPMEVWIYVVVCMHVILGDINSEDDLFQFIEEVCKK